MSQDTTALPTNPVDTTTAPRGSASNSRGGAVKGGIVSSNWNGDQGKLLFDEALSLGMDMELSDNPKAWEILTQNLSQKHGVTRSVSANKDHMKEMISLMKDSGCHSKSTMNITQARCMIGAYFRKKSDRKTFLESPHGGQNRR